jgi:hypothetical protein
MQYAAAAPSLMRRAVCCCCLRVQVGTFRTPLKDGWGITTVGNQMVLSDGSSKLTWVDPTQGFKASGQCQSKMGLGVLPI